MIKILLIMIMSIMCGHTGLNAMARFAKSHREELAEVMPEISFNQIYKAFNKWMIQYFKEENIAIDGKSINSTVSSCHDSKQCEFSILVKNLIWHVGKLENGKSSEITKVQYLIK